jgi:RNA-directed DNA polymerase
MRSLTGFLEGRMKLKVNRAKSAVDRPWRRTFLGYSFTVHTQTKITVPEKTCMKMREKLKGLFRMGRGRNLGCFIQEELNPLLRGWMNYFRLSETFGFADTLDQWIRRRLRLLLWVQWKRAATRLKRLLAAGLDKARAIACASNGRGPWFNSGASHMNHACPSQFFAQMGLLIKSVQARPSP